MSRIPHRQATREANPTRLARWERSIPASNSGGRGARFSLVEFMIAITLGLLLIMGVATYFVNSSRAFNESQKAYRQIENGRYAMDLLTEDLRHAGFYGEVVMLGGTPSGSVPDPCATDIATVEAALPLAVQGLGNVEAGPGSTPKPSCVNAIVAGTDVLVLRRASTTTVSATGGIANGYYLQVGACKSQTTPFKVARYTSTAFDLMTKACVAGNKAPLRQLRTFIYFVSPCSLPSGATGDCTANPSAARIPTLSRMELGPDGFSIVPLVEGIENLQFEYGLDGTGTGQRDGAPDEFAVLPTTAAEWASVVAVRIHLLARNIETTPGYSDSKTYQLGTLESNPVGPLGDAYARHVYTGLVRLVNVSQRKEKKS